MSGPGRPRECPSGSVQAYLRPRPLGQARDIPNLLGREFPEWKTPHAKPG